MAEPRLVSVIVATRDRPKLLAEALASIRAIEGPDLKFEILVGDNGGLPASKEVAEHYGAYHQYTPKNYCPAPRNLAMRRATGEFIAFLDDDDVWLPGHIRKHIEILDAEKEFAGVFSQIISTDPDLVPLDDPWPEKVPQDGDFFLMLLSGYFPQVGGTLFRASVLETHGYMDESLIGADRDRPQIWIRCAPIRFVQAAAEGLLQYDAVAEICLYPPNLPATCHTQPSQVAGLEIMDKVILCLPDVLLAVLRRRCIPTLFGRGSLGGNQGHLQRILDHSDKDDP